MDHDWCLSCERHLDSPGLYCSQQCQQSESSLRVHTPSELSLDQDYDNSTFSHDVLDIQPHASWAANTNHSTAISAWVADVALAGVPAPLNLISSAKARYRAPELLSNRPPRPPTLCMSNHPSRPFLPSKSAASPILSLSRAGSTLPSPLSESPLATPISRDSSPRSSPLSTKPSVLGVLSSQVRSWVGQTPKPTPRPYLGPDDDISSSSSIGDLEPVWWVSEQKGRSSTTQIDLKTPCSAVHPTNRRIAVIPALPTRGDHPAYRHRGRKASRAIS